MQISANQWNNVNSVSSINNNQNKYQMNLESAQGSTTTTDDVSISSEGGRMANRMQRMRPMDPVVMEEKMTEMNTAIEELELDSLDLDEMSREELESKVTDISATLNEFRPEGVSEKEVDLESLTDDDLKSMITGFNVSVSQVDSAVSDMTEMANGGMPPMGAGGPPPPPGGMTGMESTSETEETEEEDLIDTLIAALEADELEDEDSNVFLSAIYEYLGEKGLSA